VAALEMKRWTSRPSPEGWYDLKTSPGVADIVDLVFFLKEPRRPPWVTLKKEREQRRCQALQYWIL
jgi:hypothetical protein